ncbi:MAG: hemerythrin domain-containing protein [Zoogloea sp.]|uniref:hemerythrin domain-containing protein n=1 Tax=Zoogloea sp. TaxID=49181 RepID=UPI003F3246A3
MKAIDIIHDEHRALAAVLKSLEFVVKGIQSGRFEPDFPLICTMLDYINRVPEELHHPKEDQVLFPRIRECCPETGPIIDALEAEHCQGPRNLLALMAALVHYQSVGPAGLADFAKEVETYLQFNWDHLNQEEEKLFPLIKGRLSAADWAVIDAEFEANKSPWAGPKGEFEALFSRIVNMTPAPMGLGLR